MLYLNRNLKTTVAKNKLNNLLVCKIAVTNLPRNKANICAEKNTHNHTKKRKYKLE